MGSRTAKRAAGLGWSHFAAQSVGQQRAAWQSQLPTYPGLPTVRALLGRLRLRRRRAGESTTDVVYGGHCLVAENGTLLVESDRFHFETEGVVADLDLARLQQERARNSSFSQAQGPARTRAVRFVLSHTGAAAAPLLNRPLPRTPFVPTDAARRADHCREIFNIQTVGLAKRLHHLGARQVVLGISGGLDSTLALLVCVRAFDRLGLARSGVVAVTMPGFGTTARTRSNAEQLALELSVTLRVIPIGESVRLHFRDIGHDEERP